jgi:hypothetical protein
MERIPTAEWAVLKLVQPANSDQIVAQDGTGLTALRWNHLVLERESVARLLTDGPRSERVEPEAQFSADDGRER